MAVRRTGKLIITLLLCLTTSIPAFAQKSKDAEELGKALEYFTSAKYHEALLIFQRLDKEYKLTNVSRLILVYVITMIGIMRLQQNTWKVLCQN